MSIFPTPVTLLPEMCGELWPEGVSVVVLMFDFPISFSPFNFPMMILRHLSGSTSSFLILTSLNFLSAHRAVRPDLSAVPLRFPGSAAWAHGVVAIPGNHDLFWSGFIQGLSDPFYVCLAHFFNFLPHLGQYSNRIGSCSCGAVIFPIFPSPEGDREMKNA